jgi:hypothetical protein
LQLQRTAPQGRKFDFLIRDSSVVGLSGHIAFAEAKFCENVVRLPDRILADLRKMQITLTRHRRGVWWMEARTGSSIVGMRIQAGWQVSTPAAGLLDEGSTFGSWIVSL